MDLRDDKRRARVYVSWSGARWSRSRVEPEPGRFYWRVVDAFLRDPDASRAAVA